MSNARLTDSQIESLGLLVSQHLARKVSARLFEKADPGVLHCLIHPVSMEKDARYLVFHIYPDGSCVRVLGEVKIPVELNGR